MGRDSSHHQVSNYHACFNPRARMGRDGKVTYSKMSIHKVSIHAPAWGATISSSSRIRLPRLFQSTRPHGARHKSEKNIVDTNKVSIHAPAWGATHTGVTVTEFSFVFQSTRPHGARLDYTFAMAGMVVSIHAPAWGATAMRYIIVIHQLCFNPRARMGRDLQ